MKRIDLPTTETQIVVDLIVKLLSPCTIFVFGYSNNSTLGSSLLIAQGENRNIHHHFYLVVFSSKVLQNGACAIANAIGESSDKSITASVLLHQVTDLATQQVGQRYFFDTVLRYGQRLCLDTSAPPYLLHPVTARDVAGDTAYWLKCVGVAQFNLQVAADSEQLDVELCKIALLHSVATQVALGLLRVFLGYTPNEFGLNYLLRLCGCFTTLPSQLFHQQTPVIIKRYKMLCAPPIMLHHWTRLNAAEQDFLWLLDACETFLEQANVIGLLEIERLENESTKTILL